MKQLYFVGLCIALTLTVSAQSKFPNDSLLPRKTGHYLKAVVKKSVVISKKLRLQNTKVLDRYLNTLAVLEKRVSLIDKQTADNVFPRLIAQAKEYKSKLPTLEGLPTQYFGYLDTLQGSIKYIEQKEIQGLKPLGDAKQAVSSVQNEVGITEQTSALIESGKREIIAVIQNLVPNIKELKALQNDYFYYQRQIEEYKTLFSNPDKATIKVLQLLQKRPDFAAFMSQNSMFAGLFGLPVNFNASRSLEDLQTRSQVENALMRRIGTDPTGRQLAAAQLDEARSRFDNYKSKFSSLGSVDEMPASNPKPLKTKRLWDRLEPGGNIQFQKSNLYFPTTTDITGQLGYKFHKNGVLGIGIAYKLGMGRGWEHVAFSHQGFGIRSFLDWKLKGLLYINGGFESNHTAGFHRLRELRNWNGYQMSALMGISRKVKAGPKLNATTTLLYDFLASRQVSGTSPFKLRFGYTFK